jgi:TRAP-type uncharacterized transport system fused permease subunit
MKKLDYQPKQVRLFLVILLLVVGLVVFRFTTGHPSLRVILWAAEAILIFFFLLLPNLFFPIFKGIMVGSGYIGNFLFLVISALTFYLVLTPMALVMRLFGKKFMQPKIDRTLPTYYEQGSSVHDIEKQY